MEPIQNYYDKYYYKANTYSPKIIKSGIDIDVKAGQYANAYEPIVVTECGIIIDVKAVQYANAYDLIVVTLELGVNITDDKAAQYTNTSEFINVTEFGIIIDVNA